MVILALVLQLLLVGLIGYAAAITPAGDNGTSTMVAQLGSRGIETLLLQPLRDSFMLDGVRSIATGTASTCLSAPFSTP